MITQSKFSVCEIALNGAKYMYSNYDVDFGSGSMDSFLQALGFDTSDVEFMDQFYGEFYKWLDEEKKKNIN